MDPSPSPTLASAVIKPSSPSAEERVAGDTTPTVFSGLAPLSENVSQHTGLRWHQHKPNPINLKSTNPKTSQLKLLQVSI